MFLLRVVQETYRAKEKSTGPVEAEMKIYECVVTRTGGDGCAKFQEIAHVCLPCLF